MHLVSDNPKVLLSKTLIKAKWSNFSSTRVSMFGNVICPLKSNKAVGLEDGFQCSSFLKVFRIILFVAFFFSIEIRFGVELNGHIDS